MSTGLVWLFILALSGAGFIAGQRLALTSADGDARGLVALPFYHGAVVALAALLPASLLLLVWSALEPIAIRSLLFSGPLAELAAEGGESARDLLFARVLTWGSAGTGGLGFREQAMIAEAAESLTRWRASGRTLMVTACLLLAAIGGTAAMSRIHRRYRARHVVERVVKGLMLVCAVIAILTTFGIVFSLIGESLRFFARVPVTDFLFGLTWSPQEALRADQGANAGAFGAVPLLVGTGMIGLIALLVAVPLGLLSAIYLAEYASHGMRSWLKPVLEILAGVPTVVYGFFAILVVAPLFPPIESWYRGIMDGGVTRIWEGRLAAASDPDQAAVPMALTTGVITITRAEMPSLLERLSAEDADLILSRGTAAFDLIATPANARGMIALLPEAARPDWTARLDALEATNVRLMQPLVRAIEQDSLFEPLSAPAQGLSAEQLRARAPLEQQRGRLISLAQSLPLAPAETRSADLRRILSDLRLDRPLPFLLARAGLATIPEAERPALEAELDGAETATLQSLESAAGWVTALEGLEPGDRDRLARSLREALALPAEARLPAVRARFAEALALQARARARALRPEIEAQILDAAEAGNGLDVEWAEGLPAALTALVAVPADDRLRALDPLTQPLSRSLLPQPVQERIRAELVEFVRLLGQAESEAGRVEADFRSRLGSVGEAPNVTQNLDTLRGTLLATTAAELAAARVTAIESILAEAVRVALRPDADLLADFERLEAAAATADPAARTGGLTEVGALWRGLAASAPAPQAAIAAALGQLQAQLAVDAAAAAEAEARVIPVLEQGSAIIARVTAAEQPAPTTPEATRQLLQGYFSAALDRQAAAERSFLDGLQAEARAAHPPVAFEPAEGHGWRSWLYAIFGLVLLGASANSAIAAGLVMGVMIIPFVTSLSDDVINAVPQSLRDGSAALGATKSETVTKVVLPAALPGIVGAVLLAASRAIGETMIVVMAAGLAANLTANPFEALTTVTVQIASLLTGDQEFDSAKTLSVFALGLLLFLVTLALNLLSLRIVKKYRERYD